MLDSLRDAFREAVRNFRTELNRDSPSDASSSPVAALVRELEVAGRRIRELRAEAERVSREAVLQGAEAASCRRREELARRTGDEETARVAGDFGRRHERRLAILEDKHRILAREIEDREDEIATMRERVQEWFERDKPP